MARRIIGEAIVQVTVPFCLSELKEPFLVLERGGLNPRLMRRKTKYDRDYNYIIVRKVVEGDRRDIMISLDKLKMKGWEFYPDGEKRLRGKM